MALTFGTLLSSQGADAHDTRLAGLRSRRLFYVTPLSVSVKWRVQDPGSTLGVAVPGTTGDLQVVFLGLAQLWGRRRLVRPAGRRRCLRVPHRSRRAQRASYVGVVRGVKPVRGDA